MNYVFLKAQRKYFFPCAFLYYPEFFGNFFIFTQRDDFFVVFISERTLHNEKEHYERSGNYCFVLGKRRTRNICNG